MIFWFFSFIMLAAALVATFATDFRFAIFALWLCGCGVGGLFLSLGAELLAIIQWIVSTLLAVSFVFHAITFGEYGKKDERPRMKKFIAALLPSVAGASFVGIIWLGTQQLPMSKFETEFAIPSSGNLAALGQSLVENHLPSLELLGLTLFLVIVGSGVVARLEAQQDL